MRADSRHLACNLQGLFDFGTLSGLSDGELLERAARSGRSDARLAEAAFEVLVMRHGPMVLRVCGLHLSQSSDIDDAFQATFLVLAHRRASIRRPDSVASWLFGVANRVAARARVDAVRRGQFEKSSIRINGVESAQSLSSEDAIERGEINSLVREEVRRLPDRYREIIVLCFWEGLTQEEAATRLGYPIGTVRSRSARARDLLRTRLSRRGLSPNSMALTGIILAEDPAMTLGVVSKLSSSLVLSTVRTCAAVASGLPIRKAASGGILILAESIIRSVTMIKIKLVMLTSAMVGLGFLASGHGGQETGKPESQAQNEASLFELPKSESEARRGASPFDVRPKPAPPEQVSDASKAVESQERSDFSPKRTAKSKEAAAASRKDESSRERPDLKARRVTREELADTSKTPGGSKSDYIIEAPDLIVVEVLDALPGRPITGERLVRPDGKISLGFYGEVYVEGLTIVEAKEKVIKLLQKFLDDEILGLKAEGPDGKVIALDPKESDRVFVDVAGYNSKFYYLQGELAAPGRYHITGNETVLDAISLGGGLTHMANRMEATLYRKPVNGKPPEKLSVNLEEVLMGSDLSTNYQIHAGDRLVIRTNPSLLNTASNQQANHPDSATQSDHAKSRIPETLSETIRNLDQRVRELDQQLKLLDRKLDRILERKVR